MSTHMVMRVAKNIWIRYWEWVHTQCYYVTSTRDECVRTHVRTILLYRHICKNDTVHCDLIKENDFFVASEKYHSICANVKITTEYFRYSQVTLTSLCMYECCTCRAVRTWNISLTSGNLFVTLLLVINNLEGGHTHTHTHTHTGKSKC